MSINNKWDNFTRKDLLSVAEAMNIKSGNEIIDEIIEAVSYWRVLANKHDVPKETIEKIEKSFRG
jgi:serine/threonine-protein kinase HipA